MYKLVIFDLDGTLLDTIGDLAAAGNHALSVLKKPQHPVDAFKLFVGNGIPKLIERMLPAGHSAEEEKQALEIFSRYYGAHKSDRTAPYAGMPELVGKLSRSGIICVCNTNKAQEFSAELIRAAYGDDIREVMGAGLGFPTKPAPDAALEFIRKYGAAKSETLYVGDSSVDMMTAANAGIDGCAVLWGFRGREELEACRPAYIAENVGQLEGIVFGKACEFS